MDTPLHHSTLNHPDELCQENDKLNTKQDHDALEVKTRSIVLFGSGDMAMGLAINLQRVKLHPVIASRSPKRARDRLNKMNILDAEVATIPEAVTKGDIIIVAIPSKHHDSLPRELLKNKILVDISNRSPSKSSREQSLAENLQYMFPDSHVVKAFNTLSAYAITHGIHQGSREVPICGDTKWACSRVESLVRELGYTPTDHGALRNARAIEDMPVSFFPEWKIPFILCACLFTFNWIVSLFRSQLCRNFESNDAWDWSRFNRLPLNNTQSALAYTAATLLLVTYIPGTFAAYIQLKGGTKYSLFPKWLDQWLKCRKQLGLLALLLGTTHGCAAIFKEMSSTISGEWTEQLYLMAGAILAALLTILGITSLPSVSAQLTWREFSFIQRYLGWASVFFLSIHGIFSNLHHLLDKPRCAVIPSMSQVLFVECMLTYLLKIPLLIPCIYKRLTKIRNGYERSSSHNSETLQWV